MTRRSPNLTDLGDFGIHVMNPEHLCCRCGKSVRGFTECLFADELCRPCSEFKAGGRHYSRREDVFYRPKAVYVMHPRHFVSQVRVIWDGVMLPQEQITTYTCVVKIDGQLYVGRDRGGYVSLFDGRGNLVRDYGLRLTRQHLEALYQAQPAA